MKNPTQKTVHVYAVAVFILMLAVLFVHAKTKPQDFGWPPQTECPNNLVGFGPDSYGYFQLTKWFAGEDPRYNYPCDFPYKGKIMPAGTVPTFTGQFDSYFTGGEVLPSFYLGSRFLYPLLTVPVYVFWHSPYSMLVVPLLSAMLSLLVLIKIMEFLKISVWNQMIALSLLVFWRTFYYYSLAALTDLPFLLATLLQIWFLMKMKEDYKSYIGLAVLVGVGAWMREFSLMFIGILLIYKYLNKSLNAGHIMAFLVVVGLLSAVPQMLWGWNFLKFKNEIYRTTEISGGVEQPLGDKIGQIISIFSKSYLLLAAMGFLSTKNKPLKRLLVAVVAVYVTAPVFTFIVNERFFLAPVSIMLIMTTEGLEAISKIIPKRLAVAILLLDARNWIAYRLLYLLNMAGSLIK